MSFLKETPSDVLDKQFPNLHGHGTIFSQGGGTQSLSHVQLFATPWTVAHKATLSMLFPRQGYWSGLPFPSPGHLLNPDIEPASLMSPALVDGFFTTSTTWGSHSQMGRKNYLSMS